MKIRTETIYKTVGIFLFIYMLILLGRTSYLNYKINKQINTLKNDIESLEVENKELANNLEYYKTPQYREKVARQRLGLKRSNEEVMVIVPEEGGEKNIPVKETPNYLKWWTFLSS